MVSETADEQKPTTCPPNVPQIHNNEPVGRRGSNCRVCVSNTHSPRYKTTKACVVAHVGGALRCAGSWGHNASLRSNDEPGAAASSQTSDSEPAQVGSTATETNAPKTGRATPTKPFVPHHRYRSTQRARALTALRASFWAKGLPRKGINCSGGGSEACIRLFV